MNESNKVSLSTLKKERKAMQLSSSKLHTVHAPLFCWQQVAVFFSHTKSAPATSHPALFFSHNKSAPHYVKTSNR